ncbi:MAG: MarR family winged helix-turn-helix transcriptional regulator [Mycobacterium sp.]|nr:MarR family winged helix-turn-helix transcriptional regulator [Mycobacterium sp.]
MQKPSDPYSEFGYYVHRVVTLLDKRGDAMFRSELGISLRQFLLLRLIEMGPQMPSQQLIADRLGVAKSAVSRHIDIARRTGWIQVEVSAQSRRQNSVALTPAGQQLLAQAKTLIETSELQGFADLPAADVKATIRTLKALHQKLNEQVLPQP